jgi:hypothetical protein
LTPLAEPGSGAAPRQGAVDTVSCELLDVVALLDEVRAVARCGDADIIRALRMQVHQRLDRMSDALWELGQLADLAAHPSVD